MLELAEGVVGDVHELETGDFEVGVLFALARLEGVGVFFLLLSHLLLDEVLLAL